jgi:hypothetical protein
MERFGARHRADDQFGLRMLVGALRLISGWTAQANKDRYRIATPTATIGIRGTDHEPYVLSADLAATLKQPEGTYNKVNRGGTTLAAAGGQLEINAGQVGFAPGKTGAKSRALMTALLPSLLEQVPGFFVPGQFDAELEALAARDLAEALKTQALVEPPEGPALAADRATSGAQQAGRLEALPLAAAAKPALAAASAGATASTAATATTASTASASASTATATAAAACDPAAIATVWLEQLDGALAARDAMRFVQLFASQAQVTAQVRNGSGDYTELQYTRSELAKSTFSAMDQLTGFASRRPSINARLAAHSPPGRCDRIEVESLVIESGTRAGLAYRLESLESYTLVRKTGRWLAVRAVSRQR